MIYFSLPTAMKLTISNKTYSKILHGLCGVVFVQKKSGFFFYLRYLFLLHFFQLIRRASECRNHSPKVSGRVKSQMVVVSDHSSKRAKNKKHSSFTHQSRSSSYINGVESMEAPNGHFQRSLDEPFNS